MVRGACYRGMRFGLRVDYLRISETLCSAVDRRAFFFLSCQEKVAKKKARPVWRRAFGPDPGGTRPFPPHPALLGATQGMTSQSRKKTIPQAVSSALGFEVCPLRRRRAAKTGRGFRRGLSEPQASSAAARPVEQRREPAKRAAKRGRLFFGSFLLAKQKKGTRPSGAKPNARTTPLR
jgi:hypothetical protein